MYTGFVSSEWEEIRERFIVIIRHKFKLDKIAKKGREESRKS